MKKVLITLLALAVVAALGVGGYLAARTLLAPGLAAGGQPEEQAASSQPRQTGSPALGVRKQAETDADVLDALAYERTQNADTVAWLRVPGTDINGSVLQGYDNVEYLRLNERRKEDVYGCYFADYTNSVGLRSVLSPNTVIYGHSDLKDNPDGPRFSQLFRFTDPEFAAEHPSLELTAGGDFMDWEIFAVFYPNVSFDYIKTDLTGEELTALAQEAMSQSIYDYGVDVGPEDKILTLSTCTIKYGEGDTQHRFVVMGKLLPKDTEPPERAALGQKTGGQQAAAQTEG